MRGSREERIRELCDAAIAATDPVEVERLLAEFRIALEDHIEHARAALGCQASLLGEMTDSEYRIYSALND